MRRTLVALALALVLPLPVLAGQVTVKEGETLSEIADRHGLTVRQLMKLNDLSKADHVEAGQILVVPGGGSRSSGVSDAGRVTVQDGETLSEIAERHGMSVQQLMKLNNLSNADHVESGQTLLVSGRSKSATTPRAFRKGASEHVVRSGESLSVIADGYGIGLSKLIAINSISDPDHLEAGTRLKLKSTLPVVRPASARPAASQPTVAQPVATRPVAPRPSSTASRPTPATPVQATARTATTTATAPARTATTDASAAAPAVQPRPTASATPVPSTSRSTRLNAAASTTPVATTATTGATATAATTASTTAATTAAPETTATTTAKAASFAASRASAATTIASAGSRASISDGQGDNSTAPGSTGASTRAVNTSVTRPVSSSVSRPISSTRPTAVVATAPRAATTAVAAASGKPDWRTYGPLQIDWTGWQPMGGSMVAPTLNAQGQSLYLAINCGARKLNATTQTGDWKTWDDPSSDFELQLVNDYCRSRS